MKLFFTRSTLAALAFLVPPAASAVAEETMVAHMVYFKLKDSSADAKKHLVASCDKYLAKHEGTLYYSAGIRAEDLTRPVNDQDFDVALNVVFKSKAAHDKYQTHKRHLTFIEENRESWASVRVFDSYIKPSATAASQ